MVDGVLLDISGVLYQGDEAVPGAKEAVSRLLEAGLPVRFLTNSTRRPKRRIVEKLGALGFEFDRAHVLTPAEAACEWLRREGYRPNFLVHPDLEEDFAELPERERIAVVVGDAGPYFSYERMNAAFRLISDGAPFLALATNRVFMDADGRVSLDAGAFVHALEFASDRSPIVLGKPSPAFFVAGVENLGCPPEYAVMIGDDAESDVAGALRAGIGRAILVRTGKYMRGDEERWQPRPTAVVADLEEAVESLLDRV